MLINPAFSKHWAGKGKQDRKHSAALLDLWVPQPCHLVWMSERRNSVENSSSKNQTKPQDKNQYNKNEPTNQSTNQNQKPKTKHENKNQVKNG